MCKLCDDNDGEMPGCQDCGRLICFDNSPDSVDVADRAHVTASGDLFCARCGRKRDQEEEDEREADYYEPRYDYDDYEPVERDES